MSIAVQGIRGHVVASMRDLNSCYHNGPGGQGFATSDGYRWANGLQIDMFLPQLVEGLNRGPTGDGRCTLLNAQGRVRVPLLFLDVHCSLGIISPAPVLVGFFR